MHSSTTFRYTKHFPHVINWAACGEPNLRNGFHFFLGGGGGGGVFLGRRSGGAPSATSNLYTISEQCL